MKKYCFLSCSGGMDSTSLLIRLLAEGYTPIVVNFNYGQKHKVEQERLKLNLANLFHNGYEVEHHEFDLSSIMSKYRSSLTSKDIQTPHGHYEEESMKQTVVPNRNAIFYSLVFGLALSKKMAEPESNVSIAMGIHSGDHAIYPDCRLEFITQLHQTLQAGNWGADDINLYVPYIDGNKTSILEDAIKSCKILKLDFYQTMKNTNTCYDPDEKGNSCGKCGSCTERLEAFEKLGISDPVPYQKDDK
jgi:7-cyano-7-deazaguanine synthase